MKRKFSWHITLLNSSWQNIPHTLLFYFLNFLKNLEFLLTVGGHCWIRVKMMIKCLPWLLGRYWLGLTPWLQAIYVETSCERLRLALVPTMQWYWQTCYPIPYCGIGRRSQKISFPSIIFWNETGRIIPLLKMVFWEEKILINFLRGKIFLFFWEMLRYLCKGICLFSVASLMFVIMFE